MDKSQIKRDIAAGMSADQVKAKARGGGYQREGGDGLLAIVLIIMLVTMVLSGLAAAGVL